MTENTIQTISAEHAGATLDVTVPAQSNASMLTWTLPGGITIDTDRLLLDGGSLAEYEEADRRAKVTIRGTVGGSGNRLVLPSGDRLNVADLNGVMLRAALVTPAQVLDHVSVPVGLYACATHRDDGRDAHFFVVDQMHGTHRGGVSQLSINTCHGTTGDSHQFDDYRTCRPMAGASRSVLFNVPSASVVVRVTPDQFVGETRVAGPAL